MRRRKLLSIPALLWIMYLAIAQTQARPPQPPIRCTQTKCSVSNAYGVWNDRKECWVSQVVYPATEEDIIQAVAQASQRKQKVKVVTGFGHTIPKLTCSGSPPQSALVISTAKFNSMVEIDKEKMEVTADSGVGLRNLIDKVEEAGLSLVAAPYWEGASLGGIINTGSHGSSWWGKGGAVHDTVVRLNLVVPAGPADGFAKVLKLDGHNPLFNAAKVSLGQLGVISKVTLLLEPAFKRSITFNFTSDSKLENEYMNHGRNHEFADITWYPSQNTAVYRLDDRVPMNTTGNGKNDFIGFQSTSVVVSTAVRSTEKSLETAKNYQGKCAVAASQLAYKKFAANGLKNNDLIFTGYPVVGRQGKMQTSGSCLHSPEIDLLSMCAWDHRIKGLFFFESTAIFTPTKFRDFIIDVKKLRDLQPVRFCGVDLYNGFFIRFIKASEAYLGQPEDSVVLDFNYFRADKASTPRLAQDVWEEVEQMAFFKYGARPHWAKNRNLAFSGVQQKYPNMAKFVDAKKQLDTEGIFSSEWSDEILLREGTNRDNGCAMEGLCICSEDRHCNPDEGYLCKAGLIYKEARVCRNSAN